MNGQGMIHFIILIEVHIRVISHITFNNYTAKATGSDLKESCRYFTTQALGPTDLNLEPISWQKKNWKDQDSLPK